MNRAGAKSHWLTVSRELYFDPTIDSGALAEHLIDRLLSVSAKDIIHSGCTVEFTGGIRRWVTTANELANFDRGLLAVDRNKRLIQYKLRFYEAAVSAVSIGAMFAVFTAWNIEGLAYIWISGAMTLWICGGNMILGPIKFRRFLISALASAPRIPRIE